MLVMDDYLLTPGPELRVVAPRSTSHLTSPHASTSHAVEGLLTGSPVASTITGMEYLEEWTLGRRRYELLRHLRHPIPMRSRFHLLGDYGRSILESWISVKLPEAHPSLVELVP